MDKIKKDKLVKEAEEQAHKELADEEMKKGKSLLVEVHKKIQNKQQTQSKTP